MKAIVYTEYGSPDVLHLKEIEKPAPKDNELLIKIYATTVCYGELAARNFKNIPPSEFNMPSALFFLARFEFGYDKPKKYILGTEFAGEIEAVGNAVTLFKKGDQVFGYRGATFGANAEYMCMPQNGLVALKPSNVSYGQAATVPGGALTALTLLRHVNIQPGQKVLVNGASGLIGSHALQLARHFGADVTGVCGTRRMEFVKALGASKVIDYTKEDFTRNGETYDLIFDILGRSSFSRCKNSLTPNGRYLLASFKTKQLFEMLWTSMIGSQKVICALSNEKPEDLVFIKGLVESGAIKPIVDKYFPLEQVAEAHRYVESGNKKGHIVITVNQDAQN
jgi:NADPH:quinone reductase-like Zn-dependent oxidoreductase